MSPPTAPPDRLEPPLSDRLHEAIEALRDEPFYRPLRIRLREMKDNVLDEVRQFRQLQKAVRRSPALDAALAELGFEGVAAMSARALTADAGRLVQAFNRLIEEHWEDE